MIPAAGRGTRLRPDSDDQPKPLARIAGRPVLEWLLMRLGTQVSDVCVVVDDPGGPIRQAVGERFADIRIHYAVQPEPVGVGDAVLRAAGMVQGPFVVAMGDVYYDRSLAPSIEFWRQTGADGAVLIEPVTVSPREPIGLVDLDGEAVVRIQKARFAGQARYRVCGMAILPEEAFKAAGKLFPAPRAELELEEIVAWLIEERKVRFVSIPFAGWRRNINTPADLASVEARQAGIHEAEIRRD